MLFRTGALLAILLCSTIVNAVSRDQAAEAEAVCGRLLPPKALTADAGPGYVLKGFDEPKPEEWLCIWQTEGTVQRQLSVRYANVGADRVRPLFMDYRYLAPSSG